MTENTAGKSPQLTRMEFAYQLEGGDVETVTVANRSLIAWDTTRAVRKWPSSTDAPFLWQTFIVWHHLNTTGVYRSDFKTFQDDCTGIEAQEDEVVDPTQLEASPDSSSV